MIDKVIGNRIGSDFNSYVIDALISIRDFIYELPKNNKEFTEEDYKALRKNEYFKHKGYVGFSFSFGGKWLGGWSRTCARGLKKRDYVSESYRNALRQNPKLQGVNLKTCSFNELNIPENSIIYCDPPYEGTTKYSAVGSFNHDKFWEWCREKKKEGHNIFISEYKAPKDFRCVWQKKVNSSLTKDTGAKRAIEKLFTI